MAAAALMIAGWSSPTLKVCLSGSIDCESGDLGTRRKMAYVSKELAGDVERDFEVHEIEIFHG
jgi:hypothetical protein